MTQQRLLGGRYELDGIVGRGGMAEVFRARDIRLDRIVGVKALRNDLARDQTFHARFRREAQSAASLNHPSIVAVYDTGEDMVGGTPVPYIVMEFVEGRTLRDLLRDDRMLPPQKAAEITDGVLGALDAGRKRKAWPWIALAVVLVVLTAAILGIKFLTGSSNGVGVPSVTGMSLVKAEKAITGAGLRVGKVSYTPSASVAKNDVISTNPSYGTQVSKGSAVSLVASKGLVPVASRPRSAHSHSASPTPTVPSSPGTSSPSPSPTLPSPSPSTSCVVNILGICV